MLHKKTDKQRFDELRQLVMKEIAEDIEYGKSYEGAFNWISHYPNYYEDPEGKRGPVGYTLELHCYLLGPTRHYYWSGKTKEEVLNKAEREIKSWLREED